LNKKGYYIRVISVTLSVLLWSQVAVAQIDSLLQVARNTPDDTSKVFLYFDIADHFHKKDDTLFLYYMKESYNLSKKIDYNRGMVRYYDELGYYYRQISVYAKALDNHFNALKMAKSIGYRSYLPRINNNIGVVYRRLDDYSRAVNYHIEALTIAEEVGDDRSKMYARNSLGNVFSLMKQYDRAMTYFNAALDQAMQSENYRSLAINYNNIGELYEIKGELDEALKYYYKSLEYNRKIDSERGIAICYDCLGSVYLKSGQYNKAASHFKEAISYNRKLNDDYFTAVSLLNSGIAYGNLNNTALAIKYINDALNLADRIGNKATVRDAHYHLSIIYEKQNLSGPAYKNYKAYTNVKDSILNLENTRNISKLQTLYETEKQRNRIEFLEKEKIQKEEANERKTIFILILFIAFFLLGILAIALYRANNIKRKNNKALKDQARVITEKNKELNNQKVELEQSSTKISDSLQYAQKIQQALLPQKSTMNLLFEDYFIFYNPLSAVSGDFYWAGEVAEKTILAVADCTGHGVPGAMMSMLGNSYLNETLRKPYILHASQVLNEMRDMVVSALHQQGVPGESKDGMEMSLVVFDKQTNVLEFASAHLRIYIARYQKKSSYEIIELKGDRMPIGYYRKMNEFTDHTIKLNSGDIVYLFTDGYIDQFGGEKGQRFKSKPFKELITRIVGKPMEEQLEILQSTFFDWKGDQEQIDDVLVMGVEFPIK
jgi:serine phosphatase RsbU (regulator of sigma subunit)/Tfp pilus assembly protein PilF